MISETTASREAALTGRLAFLNTGSTSAAQVSIYGNTRPASPSDAPGASALVVFNLENPAGSVAAGVLSLLPAESAMVLTTGNPTWARVTNRDGAAAFDMDAGVAGSMPGGADPECVLDQATVYAGGVVSILSAALS